MPWEAFNQYEIVLDSGSNCTIVEAHTPHNSEFFSFNPAKKLEEAVLEK